MLKRKRTGLDDAMSVVTKFVNACNRHDADGVYACLHPDFDSIQPMYPSRNFRGADQVRRNWQAIFDAEPGFRLTVLRAAAVDDTVWLELHGAGRDAEVAGVFVMGVQGDRIRWARIYSALVEPVPASADAGTATTAGAPPLREVSRPAPSPSPSGGDVEVVEEALIAPVVDIERSGRRRRRSSRHAEEDQTAVVPPVEDAVEVEAQAPAPEAEPETTVVAGVAADADAAAPAPVEQEARVEPDVDIPPPEPEVVADPAPEAVPADSGSADSGSAEPAPPEPSPDDQPRRRFGKKSR